MTDLKARKEDWLKLMEAGGIVAQDEAPHAARLIRLYEAERGAQADYTYSLVMRTDPIRTLAALNKADSALNTAWAEILGGKDGE